MPDPPALARRSSSRGSVKPDFFKPDEAAAPPKPALLKRKSTMSSLAELAEKATIEEDAPPPKRSSFASKLGKFKGIADAPPPKTTKEVVQKAKFDRKVDAFNQGKAPTSFRGVAKAAGAASSMKAKLAAFEETSQKKPPSVRKTWKVGAGAGQYKKKTEFEGGVAPKRSIADLP